MAGNNRHSVWSTVVDFGNEGKIFVRLKRKDNLLYAVMVFKLSAGASYHPMELGDLRNLERAVLTTKTQLEASRLDTLARKKEAEMMRLGILEKVWRWVVDAPLWREDVVFTGGTKISFRIRRKVDKHSEVVFRSGEEIFRLQVRLRELEALESALLVTKAAFENSRNSSLPTPHRLERVKTP